MYLTPNYITIAPSKMIWCQ